MQQNDWLSNRVTYIQALKKPSEAARAISASFEKPNRSAEEQKQLDILVKAGGLANGQRKHGLKQHH